ncbi:MAG: GAF domain-containing protein [Methylobacterium radiotolerans]
MASSVVAQHAVRVHGAIEAGDAAKSALVASWRRSAVLHHLDPADRQVPRRLTEAELVRSRQSMGPMIRAAQTALDRLYQAVGGIGCCVLLADRDGVSVERRGADADDDTFQNWGLWTGVVWSERSEGTNGIGTCLAESRALTIHRDQHFLTRNTSLSCATAPIHDHEGTIAAVLDVSSCRDDLTDGFLKLISAAVVDAALRIEGENFRLAFPQARIVIAPTASRTPGALVAVDREDMIVGATHSARLALGITADALAMPLPAADFLGGGIDRAFDLRMAERAVLERALIWADGNVTAAARNLGLSRATLHRKIAKYRPTGRR